jgi:hypothetical protein
MRCKALDSLQGGDPGGFNAMHFNEHRPDRGWHPLHPLRMDTTNQEASAAPAASLGSPAGKDADDQ